MKILVLNGPNMNLLGVREIGIYGCRTYAELEKYIREICKKYNIECDIYQSNHEGDLVDKIQEAYFSKVDGIIINPAAYTHTSIAIADALKSVGIKCVEVHISDIYSREEFRKKSFIEDIAILRIIGKGFDGYREAIEYLVENV